MYNILFANNEYFTFSLKSYKFCLFKSMLLCRSGSEREETQKNNQEEIKKNFFFKTKKLVGCGDICL